MARKPQTIYQYFNEYSEEMIDKDNNIVGPIKNTENYQSSSQVKANPDNTFADDGSRASMSQIEKFNKRYKL